MYNFPASPRIGLSTMVFRTLAGVVGGAFGSTVVLIGVLLSSSLITTGVTEAGVTDTQVHPLFVFLVVALAFLASFIADLATVIFMTYLNREKYTRLFSTLSQIFIINIVLTLCTFPLYILVSGWDITYTAFIIAMQAILSIQSAVIIQELMAGSRHIILTLYASTLAIATIVLVGLFIYFGYQNASPLAFLGMPLAWGVFGFWTSAGDMTYQWLYNIYGQDFLSVETSYGEDYGKQQ